MDSSHDTSSVVDVCSRILRTVDALKSILPDNRDQSSPDTFIPALLPSTLPDPPPIYSALKSYGLSSLLAKNVSDAYIRNAMELKHRAEETIRHVCQSIAQLPRSSDLLSFADLQANVQSTWSKIYLRRLQEWHDKALELAKTHVAQSAEAVGIGSNQKTPSSFNHVSNRI
jgi:hypothetical protein